MCSTWATESCRRRLKTSCERSWGSSTNRPGGDEEAVVSRISDDERTAVLLTAVGGPNSLDEVGPFLLDVRGGRPTSDDLVNEFRERYRRIGGKSPLLDISRAQARALEDRLNADHGTYRCYVGMRNWGPYIRDVLSEVATDDFDRIVVLPLTPYNSRRSVGAYFAAVDAGLSTLTRRQNVAYVESWNTEPALIGMFAAKVRKGLERLAERRFHDPAVVFTAHSLPTKLIDEGDPYERELSETMALVLRRLPPLRARMAWQSAGRTEEAWLGPSLEEVLYDVVIEARAFASERGLQLERTDSPNTDPGFIDAMAAAVRSACRPSAKPRSGESPAPVL